MKMSWSIHSYLHFFSWSHFLRLGTLNISFKRKLGGKKKRIIDEQDFPPSNLDVFYWLWTLLSEEKSAVHLILGPLYVMSCLSLLDFMIFSLSLAFNNLTIMFPHVALFVSCLSWMDRLMFLIKFGRGGGHWTHSGNWGRKIQANIFS